jgi:ABC-2 type transport system ATP-binding protein
LLRDGCIRFVRPLAELKSRLCHAVLNRPGGWTAPPALAGVLKARVAGASLHLLLEDVPAERLHQLAKDEDASLRIEMPTLEDLFVELA